MTSRRQFITLLGGAAAAWPVAACGKQDDRIRALQRRILLLQAENAAQKIDQFIGEMESQIGWISPLPWRTMEDDHRRRFDGLRLLRQAPPIVELSQFDATGKQRICVSRSGLVCETEADFSQNPKFTEAIVKKIYYGPVYFRRESEPYMTLSLADTRKPPGVIVAEVSLKLLWDMITEMKVGQNGQAYLIDARNRLIAHPDIRLVLRNTDMSKQALAALDGTKEPVKESHDIQGRKVLTAYAPIWRPRWFVFVELPIEEVEGS